MRQLFIIIFQDFEEANMHVRLFNHSVNQTS